MQAVLVRREPLAPTIITYWFRPEAQIAFLAGQYIDLFLPHEAVDSRGANRWFSISSAPQDDLLGVTIRFVPHQARSSSFKSALQQLPIGAPVTFGEVLGDFVVPKDTQIPLVFVGSGVGVTPFASMVRDLQVRSERRPIDLFYAARAGEKHIFSDLFASYPLQRHSTDAPFFAASELLDTVAEPMRAYYYLAGSENEVIRLQHALWEHGIRPSHIVLDYFTGYEKT